MQEDRCARPRRCNMGQFGTAGDICIHVKRKEWRICLIVPPISGSNVLCCIPFRMMSKLITCRYKQSSSSQEWKASIWLR